ncbi:YjcQ family protein [Lactococcus taiwanensis]|uniref:YjcQ family protein n=1 Tax=Lactococcus taiwanensis TaxID=1151742 RepID=UPI00289F2560|nr:YjcQ family protein [Lactococcus taiwanensis]
MDKKKIRYVILETLDEKKDPLIVLKSEEIPEREIIEQGELLESEGYIIGNQHADNTIQMWGRLTEKGEQFLEDNKIWKRAYKGLKELRDWIK